MSQDFHRRRKNPVLYTRANPPSDVATATARLDLIATNMSQVEAQLDHAEVEAFVSDEAYDRWRSTATYALGQLRSEREYLEGWLRLQRTGVDASVTLPASRIGRADLHIVADGIRLMVSRLTAELNGSVKPVYTQSRKPESLEAARNRKAELTEIRHGVQNALSVVTGEWVKYPLARADLVGVKAPLSELLAVVETETALVKAYIVIAAEEENRDYRAAIICTAALTRAVGQGFVLNAEEETSLSLLRLKFGQKAFA